MSPQRRPQRFEPRAPSPVWLGLGPLVITGIALPLFVIPGRLGWMGPPWIGLVVIALTTAAIVWLGLRIYRFAGRIAKTDGFLCLNCHYDLHGLSDTGDCPECGEPYERARLERLWETWLKDQTKNQKSLRPRRGHEGSNYVELPRARGPTLLGLTLIPVVMLFPLTIGAVGLSKTQLIAWWWVTPLWVLIPAVAIWNSRRVSRFHRRVKEAEELLCLRCHEELKEMADGSWVCVECETRYQSEGVKRRWREYLSA